MSYEPSAPPSYEDVCDYNKDSKEIKSARDISFEKRMAQFATIIGKHEIGTFFANKLRKLEDYKIIYICDDSGSMDLSLDNDYNANPYGRKKKRWDEAREIISTTLEISLALNAEGDDEENKGTENNLSSGGINIYFLNRRPPPPSTSRYYTVRSVEEVEKCFIKPPSGDTPLVSTLQEVLRDIAPMVLGSLSTASGAREKKMLIIIVTDGEPHYAGKSQISEFTDLLMNRGSIVASYCRSSYSSGSISSSGSYSSSGSVSSSGSYNSYVAPSKIPISILACTDDDTSVEYLNDLDDEVPSLDVVDDYVTERKQILAAQASLPGGIRSFSRGDYVVKCLLGSIDPEIDALDEVKALDDKGDKSAGDKNNKQKGDCVIL